MIEINNLYKKYKGFLLSNFNCRFRKGLNILQGENGSGKTTLIRCILGYARYKGSIKVNGKISYCPSKSILPKGLKVKKYIDALINLGDFEIKYYKTLEMDRIMNKMIENLSDGETKKVNLLIALAISSDILILDEPYKGLDKESRLRLSQIITKEIEKEKCVVLVSHQDVTKWVANVVEL